MTSEYQEGAEVPQPFPLERILTASAKDYCDSVEKKLSDYDMVGVHMVITNEDNRAAYAVFADKIPTTAEVVVEYKLSTAAKWEYVSGTALIPKSMPYIDESEESR